MTEDQQFMALAIQQAKIAASLGEVPVGAVLVRQGEVIAAGYNRRESIWLTEPDISKSRMIPVIGARTMAVKKPAIDRSTKLFT